MLPSSGSRWPFLLLSNFPLFRVFGSFALAENFVPAVALLFQVETFNKAKQLLGVSKHTWWVRNKYLNLRLLAFPPKMRRKHTTYRGKFVRKKIGAEWCGVVISAEGCVMDVCCDN